MRHTLNIKVSKKRANGGVLACRQVTVRERLLRFLLGSPVKDGVYYVLVHARGADGREYNIRRDVNLLRKKQEDYTSTTGGE